jgi:putative ABC transport system permease protein
VNAPLLATANLRHLARHPGLVALAVVGIAVGVAMVAGIDLANASARRAFEESARAVAGRATHQVIAGPAGIADAEVARLRRLLPDAIALAPVVEADVAVPGRPGRTLHLLGVEPFSEAPLRPYLGDGAAAGSGAALATTLLADPLAVVVARATAESLGTAAGGTLVVRVGAAERALHVVAVLDPGDDFSRRATADLAVMDIAAAQELIGRCGSVDRLDLVVPAGDGAALATLRAVLTGGAELVEAGARSAGLARMTAAFRTNLTALSLIALVVGMFLIFNTMTFTVIQRRPLLARLRALGATRRELAGLVLGEALLIGLVATALGLAGGMALERVFVAQVARTIGDLYFAVAVQELALPWPILAADAALGLAATLAAAALPAWQATTIPPTEALARSGDERAARRLLPWASGAGAALLAVAALLGVRGDGLVPGFLALGSMIIGFALLVPLLLLAAMAAIRPLARRLAGPLGAMAAGGVAANLSRTGVATAALVVAVAASLGVGVMVGSFRASVATWLDAVLDADVYASAPRQAGSRIARGPLDPALVERLAHAPGVAAAVRKRDAALPTPDGAITIKTFDLVPGALAGFRFVAGDPASAAAALARGAVLISDPFAFHHRLGMGGHLRLATAAGERDFPVAGVVVDYAADQGLVFLDRAVYRTAWRDDAVTGLALRAQPGVDQDRLLEALRGAAGDAPVVLDDRRRLREESLRVFDRTFAITGVVRLLAGLVAFIGVLSALSALQLERTREFAVLRAHGLTPGQVSALVIGQCGLIGLAAGALAMPLGLGLAAVLGQVINRRAFGWTFPLVATPAQVLEALALALGAALLAGLAPAWRARRGVPATVLRGD